MGSRRRVGFMVLLSVAAVLSASMLAPAFGAPKAVSAASVAKKLARTLKIAKRADKNAKRALAGLQEPGTPGQDGQDGTNGTDAFTDVGVPTNNVEFITTSSAFVDVTGASTTITVLQDIRPRSSPTSARNPAATAVRPPPGARSSC